MNPLKSRKLIMTLLSMAGAITAGAQGQPWYITVSLIAGAAAYCIGQGMADFGKERVKQLVASAHDGYHMAEDMTLADAGIKTTLHPPPSDDSDEVEKISE